MFHLVHCLCGCRRGFLCGFCVGLARKIFIEVIHIYITRYSVDFDISQEDYQKLSDENQKLIDNAYGEFAADPEVARLNALIFNLSFMIVSFSILIPYLLLEFVVPLLLKNGQTIGKKIFGIGVMRVDGVRISTVQLFIRTVLGKCTLETMLPIMMLMILMFNVMPLVSVGITLILVIAQFCCIAFTAFHTPIHELISATVSVDISSQLIFDTPQALLEYKKSLHAQIANSTEYK